MSSLVATGNNATAASDAQTIENVGFWPDIDLSNFRQIERLRHDIPDARLIHAATAAMIDTNRQLTLFAQAQIGAGIATHADIVTTPLQRKSHYADLYTRSVYAAAHADLLERYTDYSATKDGDDIGQGKIQTADDYRRAARWAVAEICGVSHSTVELI